MSISRLIAFVAKIEYAELILYKVYFMSGVGAVKTEKIKMSKKLEDFILGEYKPEYLHKGVELQYEMIQPFLKD